MRVIAKLCPNTTEFEAEMPNVPRVGEYIDHPTEDRMYIVDAVQYACMANVWVAYLTVEY